MILVVNVVLLWAYTVVLPLVPAHRSAAGSSTSPSTRSATGSGRWVSKLNTRHMQLAWITLGTLVVTDFYVMAVVGRLDLRPPLRQLTRATAYRRRRG